MTAPAGAPRRSARSVGEAAWVTFAVTWAAAVLFHLAGNTRLAPQWGRALLGATALVVLARPRDPRVALPLAGAVLVNVWLEAPVLGNHWLLHGLLALVVAGAVLGARTDPGASFGWLLGPARLLLLAFYAFAAFAKLNTDFFDTAVSCATFYLRETATSWGLAATSVDPVAGTAPFLVAGIELSVPVLLAIRRARHVGVLVGLGFHAVVAFDREHQFFDFSSVLACMFLLFLSDAPRSHLLGDLEAMRARLAARWPSGPELLRLVGLVGVALVVVIAAGPGEWPAPPLLRDVGIAVWIPVGAALWVLVLRAVRTHPTPDDRLGGSMPLGARTAVPVLAVLIGLTPYLEVRSSAGWNMYANLSMVDGESNHLLIRRSLPLSAVHERLVDIESSDDPSLDFYIDGDWLLPERMLLDHLAGRPGVVVDGTIAGKAVTYVGGEVPARPLWQRKFQVWRAVPEPDAVACQPSFGPAR